MKNFKLALAGIATVVGIVGASATGVFAATSTANVKVNAIIEEVISTGTDLGGGADSGTGTDLDPYVFNINVTPGTVSTNATPHKITVGTNSADGYTLKVKDVDTNTSLVNGSNTIAAHAGTFASPTALANNSWGYRLSTFGENLYAGITTSDVTIMDHAGPIDSEVANITYGILVDQSKPSGTYSDTIVYTLTTNNQKANINMKKTFSVVGGLVLVVGIALSSVNALAATQSANVRVNATVLSTISITTSTTVTLNPVPGAGVASNVDTVTVNTNSHNGYVLNLKAASSANLSNGTDVLSATSGSWTNPATMSTNSWGYRVDGLGNFGPSGSTTYAGVTTTGQNLKTTSTHASNDITSVRYGAAVNSAQPSGTYTGQVTYTATTNS